MRRLIALIPLPTTIALGATIALASPATAQRGTRAALEQRIDAYLEPLAKRGEFWGTVLVARNDEVLVERAYGFANAELEVPSRNDLRYRLYSITKQFTAMGIMILAHRGAVDIKASARAYLPELPASWQAVTVEHLLTHTSGIPQAEGRWFSIFQANDVRTQLDNLALLAPRLAADTLVSAPGARWEYNNFGYDLLGCIIERASGKELATFVRESIFVPANMRDAGFDARATAGRGAYVASAVVPRLATGYNGDPKHLQPAAPLMFGSAGAGGMYATARDLFNYDRALNASTIVAAGVQEEMIARAFEVRPGFSYGLGWMVRRQSDSTLVLRQTGGNNGYMTGYARLPKERLAVIVLSNLGFVDSDEISKAIEVIVSGRR